jgi:hypothetical protein
LLQTVKGIWYEVMKASRLAWLPALWGLWCFRRQFRARPDAWVVALFCGALAIVLCRVAWVRGYISERHTLVFVMCGSFWAIAGIADLAQRLAKTSWCLPELLSRTRLEMLFVAVVAVSGLSQLSKPMHANRDGHRLAGTWIGEHADAKARLVDPFCWADFYSGRVLREAAPDSAAPPADVYVIAEQSKLEHRWLRGKDEAAQLIQRGVPVFRCPLERGGNAEVVVYRVAAGMSAASAN